MRASSVGLQLALLLAVVIACSCASIKGKITLTKKVRQNDKHQYKENVSVEPWSKRMPLQRMGQGGFYPRYSSQGAQDGVLEYIFMNIGSVHNYYAEFGFNSKTFEGGSGANTYHLHKQYGWTGLLLDGGNENPEINLHQERITPENIIDLFDKYHVPEEVDYVSIDVDSFDLWIFEAIVSSKKYRPRVITAEYNCMYPLESTVTFPNDYTKSWAGDNIHGAAVGAYVAVGDAYGYSLVYVEENYDVFFVRDDLLKANGVPVLEKFRATTDIRSGHRPTTAEGQASLMDWVVWHETEDAAQARESAKKQLAELKVDFTAAQ